MYKSLINKIHYKLFGYVVLRPKSKSRGYALLSYISSPFTTLPWQKHTDPHSNYWEATKIADILLEKNFTVHVIDWNNTKFLPCKPYQICIDINKNLKRLSEQLPKNCKKIMHIVSASPTFQNQQEKDRLNFLQKRTGLILEQKRLESDTQNAKYADYIEGFGNSTIRASYDYAHKPIFDIPISVTKRYDFLKRDQNLSKNKFVWFGGGGAILKGLDLVLESFAQTQELELAVIGPIKAESEFYNQFKKYFDLPNIKLYDRPKIIGDEIILNNQPLNKFFENYSFIIYPSASEGTSGSVVQAMHTGLIPIVTKETGLKEDCPAIIIDNIDPNKIIEIIKIQSNRDSQDLERLSRQVWEYANKRHTRQSFEQAYRAFIDKIIYE